MSEFKRQSDKPVQLPELSVVVPTYREAENLSLLAERVDAVLTEAGITYELLFVDDDSGDGSEAICAKLATRLPISLISRRGERGLSAAVLEGIKVSAATYIVVMDADLSHPPEHIPELMAALRQGADFVVGSRYIEGASTHAHWGWFRRLNSQIPSWLSRPLSPLKDPLSGFFALRRSDMPAEYLLSPIGYKIGLEIFVKGSFGRAVEVPIHFAERQHGDSKLSLMEQLRFLRHLRRLYHFHYPVSSEFVQFGMVGASGFIIDILTYFMLQWLLGINHVTARAGSFVVAASWNWLLNRIITFSHRQQRAKRQQWPAFVLTSSLGFCINWGSYVVLTGFVPVFDRHRILALMIGVLLGMGLNFMTARLFVFRPFVEDIEAERSRELHNRE